MNRDIEVVNVECIATAEAKIDNAIHAAILLAVTEKRKVTVKHNCKVYTADYDTIYGLAEQSEKQVKDDAK